MSQVCVIGIYVPNIQLAIDFYTNVLGFNVDKHYGEKIVTLVHGELPIVLEETEEAELRPEKRTLGVVLALKTDDIFDTVRHLKEHGVTFIIEEPKDCPPGKLISFQDPFGNVLEYLQFN
ncbi:VOC family protein [Bacillus gobiensis]|uniref:VOC family protein n=1 Tax=Bacillus gobiensis TaxID=1441095 RepID=UPI003D21A83D